MFERHRTRFGRVRRFPWNNDGSDIAGPAYGRGGWPFPVTSPEQLINSCMRFLERTAVDGIYYCGYVNEPDWEHPEQFIPGLAPDPIRHVVDFAHARELEFFYSIRMNDRHQ